ncbi:MAG TPA: 2Fe-2S iron-sulfur cluster-binding protein [Polyangiaceae bacterium]|nr:2Fe-2S iron-sulfur cluster-binding protein [Polyangiaceae bacterium]
MSILRVEGFGEMTVRAGTSILAAATRAHLPLGSACGGVCACSSCHVYVKEGADLLTAQEDEEADILDKAFDVRASSRLGCQARVAGDGVIVVAISRESLESYENEHPSERGKYTSSSLLTGTGS